MKESTTVISDDRNLVGVKETFPSSAVPVVSLKMAGKRYGQKWVVREASFELYPGQIFGLVGPNGAGKTTLLKMITGLVRPSSGTVTLAGQTNRREKTEELPSIGLVIESPPVIDHLSGLRNLQLLASINNRVSTTEMEASLRQVGLNPEDKRPVRKYSLGMRQRLALAQAIMEKPELLILDEPTNGLDPQGIADLRNFILQVKREGISVLLASHLLTEVERICDEIAIIKNGYIVRRFSPKTGNESQQMQAVIKLTTPKDAETVTDWAKNGKWVVIGEGTDLRLQGAIAMPALIKDLVGLGVSIEAVYPEESDLETIYLREVGGLKQ
ncbi:MAG: putative ABC transporter ATP-binding protein YxlF [candidate division WS2 bacterium]|nr:putative ABC transporter ATP-binding protein YxlF [Candidatus Lithacetigena glycinireducens]